MKEASTAFVVIAIYLLPTIVAYERHTRTRAAVLIVDLFLGWTFIAWVVALAMAASGAKEPRLVKEKR